jgi:hypothetical protein
VTLRRAPIFIALLFCAACGGDKGGPNPLPDGGVDPDAGMNPPTPAACNPATQAGCGPDQKCAAVGTTTSCVTDGDVLPGQACTENSGSAADDCVAGYHCYEGTCTEICGQVSTPFRCNGGTTCVRLASAFTDVANDRVGVCRDRCDPLAPACGGEEGCYLDLNTGISSCARVPVDAQGIGQDEACFEDSTGTCYQNGCEPGFGALLPVSFANPDLALCSQYCSPIDTSIFNPGGAQGSPVGVPCPAGYQCRFVRTFHASGQVPPSVGMCVSTAAWGDCTECNPSNPIAYQATCLAQNARGCVAQSPL